MEEKGLSPDRIMNNEGKFIVMIPHSGTNIPDDSFNGNRIITSGYKDANDLYSREIYLPLAEIGGTILYTDIHRFVVDLNRGREDRSDGGVIRSIDFHCAQILSEDYTEIEKEQILQRYYDPFHRRLDQEIQRVLGEYGRVFILAGHTYLNNAPEAAPDSGKIRPDLDIMTGEGFSAMEYNRLYEDKVMSHASLGGLTATVNSPYPINTSLLRFASPNKRIHVVGLEVNRDTFEKNKFVVEIVQDVVEVMTNKIYENV